MKQIGKIRYTVLKNRVCYYKNNSYIYMHNMHSIDADVDRDSYVE